MKLNKFSSPNEPTDLVKIGILYLLSMALLIKAEQDITQQLREWKQYSALKLFELGNLFMSTLICLMVKYLYKFINQTKYLCIFGVVLMVPVLILQAQLKSTMSQNTILMYISSLAILYGFSFTLITMGTLIYCATKTKYELTSGRNYTLIMLFYGFRESLILSFIDLDWSLINIIVLAFFLVILYTTIEIPSDEQEFLSIKSKYYSDNILNNIFDNLPYIFTGFIYAFAIQFEMIQNAWGIAGDKNEIRKSIILVLSGIGPFIFGIIYDSGKQALMLNLATFFFITSIVTTSIGVSMEYERILVLSTFILAVSVQSIGGLGLAFIHDQTKYRNGNILGAIASFILFTKYGQILWQILFFGFGGDVWIILVGSLLFSLFSIFFVLRQDSEDLGNITEIKNQ